MYMYIIVIMYNINTRDSVSWGRVSYRIFVRWGTIRHPKNIGPWVVDVGYAHPRKVLNLSLLRLFLVASGAPEGDIVGLNLGRGLKVGVGDHT